MSLFEHAGTLPNGLVYQPRFIDEAEEARLLEGIRALDLREPRSAYVLKDDVRWKWQHSIPPTPALRYSITFRSLVARPA